MTPDQLSTLVVGAVEALTADGGLRPETAVPASVPVLAGRDGADFASPVALAMAASAGLPARDLADRLAGRLGAAPGVAAVAVTGPGYLDITLEPAALGEAAVQVLAAGEQYGAPPAGTDAAAVPDGDVGPDGHPLPEVRLAHARAASLLRQAADLGAGTEGADPALLTGPTEVALLRLLAAWPAAAAADERRAVDPGRPVRHLLRVADALEDLAASTRVLPLGDEPTRPEHRARLLLVAATRTVLGNGLALLGIDAPERM